MVFLSRAVSDNIRVDDRNDRDDSVETTIYGTRWASRDIPRYNMPDEEMPANVAYRMIKDEIALDGTPALNLASFVTTFMEDEAEQLMKENLSKNFIDFEEYPQTAEICNRCVNIIARLFHAPMDNSEAEALGCSTVGSSEAIILATLAMKRRWQTSRKEKGLPCDKPNMIMGANCQVAWHKAMRYLEIESREVPCTEDLLYMDPKKAVDWVDENTIGICAILGSTYTGHYEDVKTLDSLLETKCKENDWDIGIHVDAASGGFVAPFVYPELVWDFQLERVHSINVSGHKYGLTYPGVGWALWRGKKYLPEDLIFNINYLGSNQASFTFNFSKGASNIIAQYYVLIRLGKAGFTHIMKNLILTADYLAEKLENTGNFVILSERSGKGVPLVAFHLKHKKIYDEFDISSKLRERGWIVPAYTMAHAVEHLKLLRVVVREDFSRNRSEILIRDINSAIAALDLWDEKEAENHRKFRNKSARHNHRSNFSIVHGKVKPNDKDDKSHKRHDAPGVC
jgi:glutamate decarboxylase